MRDTGGGLSCVSLAQPPRAQDGGRGAGSESWNVGESLIGWRVWWHAPPIFAICNFGGVRGGMRSAWVGGAHALAQPPTRTWHRLPSAHASMMSPCLTHLFLHAPLGQDWKNPEALLDPTA